MSDNQRWQSPGQLLAASGGYWESCALHAGVELNLFTTIGTAALTAAEIADRSDCNPAACEQLLNALCGIELLSFDGECYSNTEFATRFLTRTSPVYLGSIIQHHRRLMEKWTNLSTVVRTGQPLPGSLDSSEGERDDFLLGMHNMGTINGPDVLALLDLSGRKSLLDVGSGPGIYAAQFCQHYPDLHATLFDRPETKPYVKDVIKTHGLEDRMKFVSGDFTEDPVGKDFDVIWGSHILHSNSEDHVQALIQKFFDALTPGGQLIIQEFILDDDKCGPAFPTLFSLNMLINTAGGRSYSQEEIEEMMHTAGFTHLNRLEPPGTASIITALKPA